MFSGALDGLGPRRQPRLGAARLDGEACDRGSEDPASAEVESTGKARIETRAIRVTRARHVDDSLRADPRDLDLSVAGVDGTPSRAQRDDHDRGKTQESFRRSDPQKALRLRDLGLVAEEVHRLRQKSAK